MPKLGKADRKLLEGIVEYSGYPRDEVLVPPNPYTDVGVVKEGKEYRVYACDPSLGVPVRDLGFFAFHFPASDIASSGAVPYLLTSTILLPPEAGDEVALSIARGLHEQSFLYNTSVVTGHTGRYESIKEPVVVVTLVGKTRHYVSPEDVRVGDLILQVGYVGAELLYGVANFKPDMLEKLGVDPSPWMRARWMLTAIDKAFLVYSMVDPSFVKDGAEGGLLRVLEDIRGATGLGYRVWVDRVEYPRELELLSREYRFDPLASSSSGLLIVIVSRHRPIRFIIENLRYHGYNASVIGEIVREGRYLLKGGEVFEPPNEITDPYATLLGSEE